MQRITDGLRTRGWSALALVCILACGGGGGGGGSGGASGFRGGAGVPGMQATRSCSGACDPGEALNEAQVTTLLDQGARELTARGVRGVIAVVDRVGNPLAVWSSDGEPLSIWITSNRPQAVQVPLNSFRNGLENVLLPAGFGAISKAVTASYLSSQGNAFSTRTANYIVHANFPPNGRNQMSGGLFGVQFSQLTCGDWVRRDDPRSGAGVADAFLDGRAGPKRSPLGLSADPGGLPLYINGVIVGGIGVTLEETRVADATGRMVPASIYGVVGSDQGQRDREEEIALAAQRGFEPSDARTSRTVAINGRTLRYTNTPRGGAARSPIANGLVNVLPAGGSLIAVPGFYDGTAVLRGVRVGMTESGIVAIGGSTGAPIFGPDRAGRSVPVQILVNPSGDPFLGRNAGPVTNPRDSLSPPAPAGLSRAEVLSVLGGALQVAREGRSQIRQPTGSFVQVNVHVCDRDGNSLGYVRTSDAPLFGSDVALQKCRTAALLSRGASTNPPTQPSSPGAADLFASEDAFFQQQGSSRVGRALGIPNGLRSLTLTGYLQRLRAFIPDPNALVGATAYSNRSVGNLARPCFPDGVNCGSDGLGGIATSQGAGPFSIDGDVRRFSPLSTGFQLDYVKDALVDGLLGRSMGLPEPTRCGSLAAGGFQIFPGSVSIFKQELDASGRPTGRRYLVGAVGVSGDGVDQDDLVSFLGLDRASRTTGSRIGNAPGANRSDRLRPARGNGTNLRYVNCPASPFNAPFDRDQNVCEGR